MPMMISQYNQYNLETHNKQFIEITRSTAINPSKSRNITTLNNSAERLHTDDYEFDDPYGTKKIMGKNRRNINKSVNNVLRIK